jgi:hypothetical protein
VCKTLDPQRLNFDSLLSFHQAFTDKHLDNLWLDKATLGADCNAGTNFPTKKGWYCNLFDLWLVRNGIANPLSLPQLEADRFTFSYHTGGNWIVITPQGNEITFHRKKNGVCHGFLYFNMHSTNAVAMVQTIYQHYVGYIKRKVQDAIAACKAQAMIDHPTDAQFLDMVRSNTIKNFPIKPAHIANALTIFGLSAAGVRGKTIFRKPKHVKAEPGHIQDGFHCLHKLVVLTVNVMFINNIAFLITLSWKLQLATVDNSQRARQHSSVTY